MTKQEREEKRRKKLQSLLAFDKEYYIGGKLPAGMDEVGRGPIAGLMILKRSQKLAGLNSLTKS